MERFTNKSGYYENVCVVKVKAIVSILSIIEHATLVFMRSKFMKANLMNV